VKPGRSRLWINERQPTRCATTIREPWNKGKLVSQKAPFKLKEIWAIRIRRQLANRRRELALFNLAIDSKVRACDLAALRIRDVCHAGGMASRAIVLQQKTQRPAQFENRKLDACRLARSHPI
jgi:hypothetical protein